MKIRGRTVTLAICTVFGMGAVASCGEGGGAGTTTTAAVITTTAGVTTTTASVTTAAAEEPLRVAFINAGNSQDGTWGQANWEGAAKAEAELGVVLRNVEDLFEVDPTLQAALAEAEAGADLILITYGAMVPAFEEVASRYPDAWVGIEAVSLDNLPTNGFTYDPEQQEGAFLAGVMAGLTTTTNKLGVVGGFPFPGLTRQTEGFTLGARFVNPDVEVQQTYLESWTDTALGYSAASAMYATGVDIIYSTTASATQGIYSAAQDAEGRYVIPQYFDQNDQAPDVILTSVLYNLDGMTLEVIRLVQKGEIESKNYSFGVDFNVGQLAPFYELADVVPQEAKARVEEVSAMIASGQIVIPDETVLGEIGAGSELDPSSVLVG